MNWFKKISQIFYDEIGHSGTKENNNSLLWICDRDGNNFKVENASDIDSHLEMVGWVDEDMDNKFRGRFEPNTKKVSIATPHDWYYNIPKNIINKLYESFGNDIEIIVFSHMGNWRGMPISELV